MRVVFMGTPDFAVASLDHLVKGGIEVVAVITAPDKPVGRGQKMSESAVKKYAVAHDIPVLQPEKLKNGAFIEELKSFNADLQVVVAFRMLPEVVWAMPRLGTINLHGSLLPQYRGAAPINWAIINGEQKTGVTTFFIEKEIDTGQIIFKEEIEIGESEDAGSLHDRMMEIGGIALLKTVNAIKEGSYTQTPQDFSSDLKAAPKIFKETCKIDWTQSTSTIFDFIRGLSPYPSAWTLMGNKQLKIFKTAKCLEAEITEDFKEYDFADESLKMFSDGKKALIAKTGDGCLSILELQLEGKKRMGVEEFLRGYRFE
jgi:methionyl-tRNA formyltransferase